jgi:hypothetical protein
MKILVLSDSHGNIANINHAVGFAKEIKAKAVIHCGDWDNTIAVDTVLSYGLPIYSVLGNADIDHELAEILEMKCTKFTQKFLAIKVGGKRVGVIHDIRDAALDKQRPDIIFFGHWQTQKDMLWKGVRAINPGALENDINFAVYDTSSGKIEFIHE